jgi:hypothetical protein
MEPDPKPERVMEYEMKVRELHNGGGNVMDFIGLDQYYKDVVEYKKRLQEKKNS